MDEREHVGDLHAPFTHEGPLGCHGFEAITEVPLVYARKGTGIGLEIHRLQDPPERPDGTPLFTWRERPDKAPHAEVYERDGRFIMWMGDTGCFLVDPQGPSISLFSNLDGPRFEARLWGIPTTLCYLHQGRLPLHASAVEVDGSAVLLAAPGRFGKTTLAGSFMRAGHRLLSEDLCCCDLSTGRPMLYPGPALLRPRRDVYERVAFPGTQVVAEDHDRAFLAVDPHLRGTADPVPIKAVFFLDRADEGTHLERVTAETAIRDLWALSLKLPRDEGLSRAFSFTTDIASMVPIWRLSRRLDYDSLAALVSTIETAVTSADEEEP